MISDRLRGYARRLADNAARGEPFSPLECASLSQALMSHAEQIEEVAGNLLVTAKAEAACIEVDHAA